MKTSEDPHIVMSRTDAQNGLDLHFKLKEEAFIIMAGTLFDTSEF